ncbi:GAF domain-containing sensor histidine kinase [Candidatus Amesbacteria bacterium]|nr:GAF domain-containing sensor histidine kinase [Candidatus Amesbacteria bacterium]
MDPDSALQKANEEIYKRNFELSIRNRTLSALRALYAISMSTLDVSEVCQRIVDTIVKELNFSAALISLVDSNRNVLFTSAITKSASIDQAINLFGVPLSEITIPLDYANNLLVTAINTRERQISGNILDILIPRATQELSDEIEKLINVKTLIVYPLFLDNKILGTLTVGIPKKVDDLSRAENETLNELINVVSLAIDRAQLHESLRQANVRLQQLDKAKDEFVSLASHELRTPMTAIKSYVWMVLNKAGPVDPKAKQYLELVFNSTERLIHLVNDMLDISRIESGKIQLKLEPFDMLELLKQIVDEFKARAADKKITLSLEPSIHVPLITADRDKIMQVLENLVGNSLKFIGFGRAITLASQVSGNYLATSVTDTGRGISEEELGKLFTKFERGGAALTALSEPGTGLGLYLCKQYIELHKGTISVKSQVGQGSTFTFSLPLQ